MTRSRSARRSKRSEVDDEEVEMEDNDNDNNDNRSARGRSRPAAAAAKASASVLRRRDPNAAAEDEDDDNDDNDDRRTKKNRKKKHVVVMRDSQQTDEERRLLRQQQRVLQKDIATLDELENPESDALKQVRFANNELWDHVKYVREAVLDGDNLEMLSSRAVKQTTKLDETAGVRYDINAVIRKLVEKCGSGANFNWSLLGTEAGACFNTVPTGITFMQGPIDDAYVPKERKPKPKRVAATQEEDSAEIKAEEVQTLQKDADALSAVEKHIRTIHKTLKRKAAEKCQSTLQTLEGMELDESMEKKKQRLERKGVEPICAVQCLFNPQSFTQTVENIFHFSFLIKQGSAAIAVGPSSKEDQEDDGNAVVPMGPKIIPKKQGNTLPEVRQSVLTLDMSDWRQMCSAYGVTESDVPHRTGSKHTKK